MAICVAVTNRKGGTGKTTIATHLAGYWAGMGYRVCLVDADSQGSAALAFGLTPKDDLYNLLAEDADFTDVLTLVPPDRYTVPDQPTDGALFMLRSSSRTSAIPAVVDDVFIMDEKVDQLKKMFDVVLIDTNPTVTAFDAFVYLATDHYIFVTTCEELSIHGLRQGVEHVRRFTKQRQKFLGKDAHVLGIVPNKMDGRYVVHKEIIKQIVEEFPGKVWRPLMQRARYVEASAVHQLIYTYEPTGSDAEDMRKIAQMAEQAVNRVIS